MLPIRDNIRSNSFPIVNWLLIGINIIVFLFELTLSPSNLDKFIQTFGLVPSSLQLSNPLALINNPFPIFTLFSHMFLHGGWFHILSNLWVLYIFGDNVEDHLGSFRYFIFYILGGITAGIIQAVASPTSQVPAIGASGAIAAVLGAYFLLFPNGRVTTLIPLFFIPWFVEVRAIVFLGIWFILQLFSGFSALGLPENASMGGVAWFAHIGGFIFGFLTVKLFSPKKAPAYSRHYPDEYYPW
jgi:membrane associated rhomboid family serine protease